MAIWLTVFGAFALIPLPPVLALWARWKAAHRSPNQGMWCLVGFVLTYAAGVSCFAAITANLYQWKGSEAGETLVILTLAYIIGELWLAWWLLKPMLKAAMSSDTKTRRVRM